MTGIIYCGAEERLIRFNLRRRNTIRGSRHILSMCSAVPPSDFPNFRGIVRFSFLLFPLLLFFFFFQTNTVFFSSSTRAFVNERGNTVANSAGGSGRSNWTKRKVGQKGWEASKLQSSTIVLCNLPLVASVVEGWLNWTLDSIFRRNRDL